MVEKIRFKILKNGEVEIDVDGVKGDQCLKLTEPFEAALGQIKNIEMKDSFYEENNETIQNEEQEG